MEYPLYILDVEGDDRLIVDAVGLVENPAIERKWMAFSKEKALFNVVSEEKMVLAGPLMVADLPMERMAADGSKYYVSFPAKSILNIVRKLKERHIKLSFNYDHNRNNVASSAYLLNDFIISEQMGILTPKGHDKLSDGSWFGVVQFQDKGEYEEAKKTRTGFSIEGYFNEKYLKDEEDIIIHKVKKLINNYEKIT